MRWGPHQITVGRGEARHRPSAVSRLLGQDSRGPSGVVDQSNPSIRPATEGIGTDGPDRAPAVTSAGVKPDGRVFPIWGKRSASVRVPAMSRSTYEMLLGSP